MTGKLVLASEKSDKKSVKESVTKTGEPTFIQRLKSNLAKLEGMPGTPESKWQISPLEHEVVILKNTIYHDLGDEIPITLNICNEIVVQLDTSMEGCYDNLIKHIINKENLTYVCNFSNINAINNSNGINATKIVISGSMHPPIGYYLPEYNTFIFGNISWHKHYSEIIMPAIWPQILEKLHI